MVRNIGDHDHDVDDWPSHTRWLKSSRIRCSIAPLLEKVKAVRRFPQPETQLTTVHQMENIYHRFLPHFTDLMRPLHTLLPSLLKLNSLTWTPRAMETPSWLERGLCSINYSLLIRRMISLPAWWLMHQMELWEQCHNSYRRYMASLSFISKKLTPAETQYNTFDRELLAVQSDILLSQWVISY